MRWTGRPEQKHQRTTFRQERLSAGQEFEHRRCEGATPYGKPFHPSSPRSGSDGRSRRYKCFNLGIPVVHRSFWDNLRICLPGFDLAPAESTFVPTPAPGPVPANGTYVNPPVRRISVPASGRSGSRQRRSPLTTLRHTNRSSPSPSSGKTGTHRRSLRHQGRPDQLGHAHGLFRAVNYTPYAGALPALPLRSRRDKNGWCGYSGLEVMCSVGCFIGGSPSLDLLRRDLIESRREGRFGRDIEVGFDN